MRKRTHKRPDVVLVKDMGPVVGQLRALGLFKCHVVVPPCKCQPYAEVHRKGIKLRSLFCRKHAEEYARHEGLSLPDSTEGCDQ